MTYCSALSPCEWAHSQEIDFAHPSLHSCLCTNIGNATCINMMPDTNQCIITAYCQATSTHALHAPRSHPQPNAKTGSVIGTEPATGRIRHFQNFPFAKITPVLSHCWLFFFYLNCQWNNGCWGKPVTVKIATYQQPWRFKAGWHSGPFTFCRSQPLSHPAVLSSFFCSPSSFLLIPEAVAGISRRAVFTLLNLCEESGGRGWR